VAVVADHRLRKNKKRSHGASFSARAEKLICFSVARFFAKGKQCDVGKKSGEEMQKTASRKSGLLRSDETQNRGAARAKAS
jgi:hypothetical protein